MDRSAGGSLQGACADAPRGRARLITWSSRLPSQTPHRPGRRSVRSLILTLRKFSCSGGGQIRRGASLLGRGGEKKGAPLRNVCPRGPRAAERRYSLRERERGKTRAAAHMRDRSERRLCGGLGRCWSVSNPGPQGCDGLRGTRQDGGPP